MKTSPLLILASAFCAILPTTSLFALDPPPGGAYPNGTTALGQDALFNCPDSASAQDVAVGFQSLYHQPGGTQSVGVGDQALFNNTVGGNEVAIGYQALLSNTTGDANVAVGASALASNTTGFRNIAMGTNALLFNTTGMYNTGVGDFAISFNTTGGYNTGLGAKACSSNSSGHDNTGIGYGALNMNTTGINNVAIGSFAYPFSTTGSSNIVVGFNAGSLLKTGSNNIEIGHVGGSASEASTIRLGTPGTQTATYVAGVRGVAVGGAQPVVVSAQGQLGVKGSSARFKEAIEPIAEKSAAILALRPVSYRYRKELDPSGESQFGLVAEEVAKVAPELVERDAAGKPFPVRYEEVNAMLLNEFLREHQKVEAQGNTIDSLQERLSAQDKINAELAAAFKTQAEQLQKLSAQLQNKQDTPRLVSAGE